EKEIVPRPAYPAEAHLPPEQHSVRHGEPVARVADALPLDTPAWERSLFRLHTQLERGPRDRWTALPHTRQPPGDQARLYVALLTATFLHGQLTMRPRQSRVGHARVACAAVVVMLAVSCAGRTIPASTAANSTLVNVD